MAQGLVDSSFKYHLTTAKKNGITKAEIAEILTHAAFYAGWPKAWAAFYMAKEVWTEERDGDKADHARKAHEDSMVFPIGQPNDGFAQYFVGQSYLAPVSTDQAGIFNVTFEPGCRNTGISTMGTKAADRSWSAWQDEDITRKKEKRHGNFIQEM